jgi:hypothetical protein
MHEISFDWTFRNRCGGGGGGGGGSGGGGHTEVATTPKVSHARTSTPEQRVKSKKTVKRGHLLLHGYRRFPEQAGSSNTKSKTIQNFSAKHKPV